MLWTEVDNKSCKHSLNQSHNTRHPKHYTRLLEFDHLQALET